MTTADLVTQLKQDFDNVYAAGKAAGGGSGGPSGYWERWVEVGNQIGPSDFDWPKEKVILNQITSASLDNAFGTMPDGTPAHLVMNGIMPNSRNTCAYKEVYQGGENSVVDNARYAKVITFESLNIFGKKEVELNFDKLTTLLNLFQITSGANKNTTVEYLTINCSTLPTSIQQVLYSNGSTSDDKVLKSVTFNVDTSNATNFSNASRYLSYAAFS
jgi:hypothetical protein